MAARILAQVLVAATTVVFRAATQAWGQALVNAQKTGVAQEASKTVSKAAAKGMATAEAQMILGVKDGAPWGEVVNRFKHLFEINEKHGSFYLQSKVYRARESLEVQYKEDGTWEPGHDDGMPTATPETPSQGAEQPKDEQPKA